jgi:hypothetical protein
MDDKAPMADASSLPGLVLQPEDLGERFVRFADGRIARADLQPGPRADVTRFGRVDGWKARYRLDEAGTPPGPLVVVSMADLFADEGGAKRDIDAYREEFELARWAAVGVARTVDVPAVGDETFGTSLEQAGVFYYTIAWRFENVTASVLVQGFELSLEDAVALARTQQQRIAKASGRLGVVWARHRSEVERLVEDLVADAGVARDVA